VSDKPEQHPGPYRIEVITNEPQKATALLNRFWSQGWAVVACHPTLVQASPISEPQQALYLILRLHEKPLFS